MLLRTILVSVLLTLSSSCISDGTGEHGSADQEALQGRWLLLEINRGGVDINLDSLEGAVRDIGEETYSITPASGTTITGSYVADSQASPRTIDQFVDNGRFGGKTLKGIYRVQGNRLTISFGGPGEARPASFESVPGTAHTVAIHERVE